MPKHIDKQDLLAKAAGRWRAIVLELCPGLGESSLNGKHGPCPKCGGTDRFRALPSFDSDGAAYCNQCYSSGNGDGLAFLMWWNGWDFPTALAAVDKWLNDGGAAVPAVQAAKQEDARSPFERWQQQDATPDELRTAVDEWAKKKPGVDATAVIDSDPMLGFWPKGQYGQPVLGFVGYRGKEKAALHIYRLDGTPFPAYRDVQERKSHNVGGSKAGWIFVGGRKRFKRADVVWRVEGLTDGFALLPLLPANHAIVTNTTGCAWSASSDRMPPLSMFKGKDVIVAGDADKPGQKGVMDFANDVNRLAKSVLLLRLPFPLAETHGADVRDWLTESPRSFEDLESLMVSLGAMTNAADLADDDDTSVPSFRNFDVVLTGKKTEFVGLPMSSVLKQIPPGEIMRVDRQLFIDQGRGDYASRVYWLNDDTQLFGWLGSRLDIVPAFRSGIGFHSKKEVFSETQRTVNGFEAVQIVPHEPKLPKCYYACDWPDVGDGSHLQELLDFFSPAGPVDGDLIKAMFLTAVWGGGCGKRPVFAITADGPGSGKSALVAVLAELVGGLLELSKGEDFDRFKARLLSSEGRRKRLVLYDNVKSWRLSWPQFEALVTSPVISGRQNNVGEASRPNDLLWVLTGNGLSLGKDIAQRSVVIRLARPEFRGDWDESVMGFVRQHRMELLGDLIGTLRQPATSLAGQSRWGQWESEVLARLPEPSDAQAVIAERQEEADVEADEVEDLVQYFGSKIEQAGFDTSGRVFLSWDHCLAWCGHCFGKPNITTTDAGRRLSAMRAANPELSMVPRRTNNKRGVLWTGDGDESRPIRVFGDINPMDRGDDF
ncbi:Zinc-binding domain of primase-helicase [Fuerstiella marisgermanici]|uniref:Zinc-binding domain of primase-helicase n=2 Tax=Fuerstiella marisgermanici TaxID=1891926 RepID=A0A1P8WKM2_9PLAN|nr:Zinc-binding domain of primase-helicase [Fuerstiella marisgermanici]